VVVISPRYHAVSIAAVFLALAVGVVLGASGLSDRLLTAVSAERDDLAGQVQALTAERDALAVTARVADEFAGRIGPGAVRGVLDGRTVVLVTAGADPADRDAVAGLVRTAGGEVTGEVALTDAVGDPVRGDQLRELAARLLPAGAQLPAAADTGTLAGGLLGSVLVAGPDRPRAGPEDGAAVLSGLATAGFVTPGTAPAPASLVVVLTGGARTGVDAGDSAAVLARLAAELDRAGGGVVLAGRAGSATSTGAVGIARSDSAVAAGVSTVDDVHTGSGRVAAVLALREQVDGRAGHYGSAEGADGGAAPAA